MRIATEDIKTVPTELLFTEEMAGLNQFLGQDGEADYLAVAPLHVALTHVRSGGELLFSGAIRGEFTGQCGRCLESYPLSLTREFSVVLTPQPPLGRETELSYDELSASFYDGETIDVSALVLEQTLLTLPSAPLCREDCKGLCPQCGTNRNEEACDCQSTWREPRLSVFSSLRVAAPETGK